VKIAIVAGELSGDILGAGLMTALRSYFPEARFAGIGGERMVAQGCESLFPLEKLSVMGLAEVLKHLPELLRLRRSLYRWFMSNPPDVFIGIDAPEFNLSLARRLRAQGIRTVQYVSPQVWAWREYRVRKIASAVDLILALLPFEEAFYRNHRISVRYVGHPLADEIPIRSNPGAARRRLGLSESEPLVGLLPGSRLGEVRRLAPLLLDTALWLRERRPQLSFIVPAATAEIARFMEELLKDRGGALPLMLLDGQAREAMTAADVALLASGTASLEAMLLKRPMVVTYKVAPLSAWIGARLLKVSRFALPNLLAERDLVSEFMQKDATVDNLGTAVLALLDNPEACSGLVAEFEKLHELLRRDASRQAAEAIADLLDARPAGT
jgi:lipid-A-disaccharide synthase